MKVSITVTITISAAALIALIFNSDIPTKKFNLNYTETNETKEAVQTKRFNFQVE